MIGLMMAAMLLVDSAYPVCNAMVCPERTNDLVWENDKFGMRASVRSVAGGCRSAAASLKPVPVALTFDDGCEAHESIAAPLLEARGWRGTFNPITDSVSKGGRLITWKQLRNLVKRGHVVTSHSCSHPNLVKLLKEGNTNEVRRQIADSRDRIKREIGVEPEWFCSPFVAQNDTVIRIAAEEGMKVMTVRRVIFGQNYPPDKDYGKLIDAELEKHPKALDFLIHGITKKTGGFAPFEDEKDFCDFLDAVEEREKKGRIKVVPYVRAYEEWNRLGQDPAKRP